MNDKTIERAVEICSGERRRYSISECSFLADVVLQMAREMRATNGSGIAEPGKSDRGSERASGDSSEDCD